MTRRAILYFICIITVKFSLLPTTWNVYSRCIWLLFPAFYLWRSDSYILFNLFPTSSG